MNLQDIATTCGLTIKKKFHYGKNTSGWSDHPPLLKSKGAEYKTFDTVKYRDIMYETILQ